MKGFINNITKVFVAIVVTTTVFVASSVVALTPVAAQTTTNNSNSLLCQIFPFLDDIGFLGVGDTICSGTQDTADTTASGVGDLIRFSLSLIFIIIILVAVVYIIQAAIKYIRSEGNEEKVQESQKAIKAVFFGVGALFVGILGLVLILILFQSTTALSETETPDTIEQFLNQ